MATQPAANATPADYLIELCRLGQAAGLDAMGVAPAESFTSARQTIIRRKQQGLSGGMQFTYRNPKRSTTPKASLPRAASVVVGALAYGPAEQHHPNPAEQTSRPQGQIAGYAQRDYYAQLRTGLDAVAERLNADGWRAKVVIDDNALVDREAAFRSGLGWYGKNTCLLIPGKGSQFVLGSVITDAVLPPGQPSDKSCGSCRLCQQACPTGALDVAGQLDARRCLAWLLQQDGIFPRQFREALHDRFYGCDSCQTVCPVGQKTASGDLAKPTPTTLAQVDLLAVLQSSDKDLLRRYGRFYIAKRQPRYLRRNALVGLGNIANADSQAVQAALRDAVADRDPIVRAHAVWAARRLGLEQLAEAAKCDPDARVRQEYRLPVKPASTNPAPSP